MRSPNGTVRSPSYRTRPDTNFLPAPAARRRIPEKSPPVTVAAAFTSMPTIRPRPSSIAKSTSLRSLSRKCDNVCRSSLQPASFIISPKTNVSSNGPNGWRFRRRRSGVMPVSAASNPESRKCSLGDFVSRFRALAYQGGNVDKRNRFSKTPTYFCTVT